MLVHDLAWSAAGIGVLIGLGAALTLVGVLAALVNRRLREPPEDRSEP
jgi:uncharacterized membrane protein YhiD involved in acid resistance